MNNAEEQQFLDELEKKLCLLLECPVGDLLELAQQ